MKKYLFTGIAILFAIQLQAQYIKGVVKNSENSKPLSGVIINWLGTTSAMHTNTEGEFMIEKHEASNLLVISILGFDKDTITVVESDVLTIYLNPNNALDEIIVETDTDGEYHSTTTTHAMTTITSEGLNKLPCCNLSESFENNASVDVSYSDAVSGAKQIQLLGLAGVYSQILRENLPVVRGLSGNYGLTHIPGPWLQSIQISKGASSVRNGYESVTGQINTEFKKPEKSDKLFVNLFGNSEQRMEANITTAFKITPNWSTMLLAHGNMLTRAHDLNSDGFADMPTGQNLNLMNRWKYYNGTFMEAMFGISVMSDERSAGQIEHAEMLENPYLIELRTRKAEAWAKVGFILPDNLGTIGTMYSANLYEHSSVFGLKNYSGSHNNLYINIIYEKNLGYTSRKLEVGTSYLYDDYREIYSETAFNRIESVPGVFTQFTYTPTHRFNIIAGLRADYHNVYGIFYTPRIHTRFEATEQLIFRASAGKGYRTASVFAENAGIFASSRTLILQDNLNRDEAWNYGATMSYKVEIEKNRDFSINLDAYRTDFIKQVITDLDASAHEIRIQNLNGQSFANSFQAEIAVEPLKQLDITAAIRYNDVKITLSDNKLHEKPFVNRYKGLVTVSYTTRYEKWKFDITNQFNGTSRLPDLSENPTANSFTERSKPYYILHAQITKKLKHVEFYIGGENLFNFRQKNPIIDPQNPFGEHFDATMVWGPIFGRAFYGGLRFTLN